MDPRQILRQTFGFSDFLPGQERVIAALRDHGTALAVFPTGAGKSLCYQLPAIGFEGLTLVVSPLIALMKDQIDFLRSKGVPAARMDSSLTAGEAGDLRDEIRSGALKLLYVSPERFNNERFIGDIRRTRISLFAVDEAHCISEWGHNFRPDYLKLAQAARDLGAERILALTATATPAVVEDICRGFGIPREAAVVTGFYRPNLQVEMRAVTPANRDQALLSSIRSRPPGATIVYVTLQKTAERIALLLAREGLPAEPYHAGLSPEQRHATQERWMASDDGIVVATIAFGMGIDKPDVRYVYHYNLPKSLESYSQEIGRAGRDGLPSLVELLACPEDVPTLENFAYGDTPDLASVRGLVSEVLSLGENFDVSLYDLSDRHDIRQLVLRTALTYLELDGILSQGTPFFAGYELKPLVPVEQIVASFPGEPGEFLRAVLGLARQGRVWLALNPDTVAEALGQPRKRVVRALEVLEERGVAELRAADVRQRYTRLKSDVDSEAVAAELLARFARREAQEVERVRQVMQLVTHNGCQTNHLVAHFGESRKEPCGHCTFCRTGQATAPAVSAELTAVEAGLDTASLFRLVRENPGALGTARQMARFLCGLSSPATIRAKLTRHPLFGAREAWRFADVAAWCKAELLASRNGRAFFCREGD